MNIAGYYQPKNFKIEYYPYDDIGTNTTGTVTLSSSSPSSLDYYTWSGSAVNTDCYTWAESGSTTATFYHPKYAYKLFNRTGNAVCDSWAEFVFNPRKSPLERLKDIIQKRQAPGIIIVDSKRPMPLSVDIREQRARETLMRLIGQERYFKFLKTGFVSAFNRVSGRVYQIFPGHGITKVFENGQLTARLCVVLNQDFPPTDSIIMRYLLALNDEQKLWNLAIKHGIEGYNKKSAFVQADIRPLTDILKELKKVA